MIIHNKGKRTIQHGAIRLAPGRDTGIPAGAEDTGAKLLAAFPRELIAKASAPAATATEPARRGRPPKNA
ncbi:MAG: hypothetical protein LBC18_13820 [Opitutaceae bacterium]|jgi:hypothetical protein|nr:hypothetical protein [Opitutaceae bacterium]